MNKKGFTLIELLAVILILAIIALIAIPAVTNVIEDSKKRAAKDSAYGYIEAVKNYTALSTIKGASRVLKDDVKYNVAKGTVVDTEYTLAINDYVNMKGSKPTGTKDYVILKKKIVYEGQLTLNGYLVLIRKGKVTSVAKGDYVDIKGISFDPSQQTMEKGSTLTLRPIFQPTNASDQTVRYESNNTNIVTVTNEGVVTAVGNGTAVVTVISEDDPNVTETISITVITNPTGLTLSPASMNIAVGQQIQLTGVFEPSDTTTTALTWATSDSTKVNISNSGVITGMALGEATITATTVNGISATATITVVTRPVKISAGPNDTHKGIVYMNPKNLSVSCSESNSQIGTGSANASGCMKFYIFDDEGSNYKLIVDHNTSSTGWLGSPRNISANEVAHIVGADRQDTIKWDSSKSWGTNKETQKSWFYLDGSGSDYTGWQTQVANSSNQSRYYWLFDYLLSCSNAGCRANSNSYPNGYRTSDSDNSSCWTMSGGCFLAVSNAGKLQGYADRNSSDMGSRPVITIPKTDIISND